MATPTIEFFVPELNEYHALPLGVLRMGMAVQDTEFGDFDKKIPSDKFGFITGFARNCTNELVLEVRWDTGDTQQVHPANLIMV